jgi:penicillin-binding protein 1A
MLSRVVVAGTGGAAQFGGWDIAGKTGTSQEWRDAWFLGYTTRYVGGVWVGNDDDKPMARITGGEMSARIWADMMRVAHEGITPESLPGAKSAEAYMSPQDLERLNFYQRMSSAFGQVAARGGG